MASFPSAIKVFTTKTDLADVVYAADMNLVQEEIVAIQSILGTNPQGSSSTVKERLAEIGTGKANTAHTHGTGDITTGTLGVARGGTGLGTLTAGSFLQGNGTGSVVLRTPAQVRGDIGAATSGHNHDTAYAPLNTREQFQSFSREGDMVVFTGRHRLIFPWNVTLLSAKATLATAPAGAAVILDINKNGTTVFPTQSNRPTIAAGANASALVTNNISGTAVTTTDYLTVDVDQIGSTTPGADLVVIITFRRT